MADDHDPSRGGPERRDRHAYLEEQIARQKRGEPVDVEWVRSELERVRQEQTTAQARTRRQLLAVTIVSAVLLIALWIRRGGFEQRDIFTFGLILIGLLTAWAVRSRRG